LQIQNDKRNLSVSALYRLFLSGISLVYLIFRDPTLLERHHQVFNDLDACSWSLQVFVEQLPWATGYRDCFAQIMTRFDVRFRTDIRLDAVFESMVNDTETSTLPEALGSTSGQTSTNRDGLNLMGEEDFQSYATMKLTVRA
jgi:hypothetical protein